MKKNRTGRSKGEGQYFKMSYRMAQSEAVRSLSGGALKVFIELRCRFNGYNNGKLTLSMDEAARLLHMSKATACRALEQLMDRGLVKRTKVGEWCGRRASEYAVTDRSVDGVQPTNEWNQWQPAKKPKRTTKKQRQRPTKKSALGTYMKHIGGSTVPPEYRRQEICSVRVPVDTVFTPIFGTDTEHLYIPSQGELDG